MCERSETRNVFVISETLLVANETRTVSMVILALLLTIMLTFLYLVIYYNLLSLKFVTTLQQHLKALSTVYLRILTIYSVTIYCYRNKSIPTPPLSLAVFFLTLSIWKL